MKQERPKLIIKPDGQDRLFIYISRGLLIILILLPVIYYGNLPDVVPVHFNMQGEADRYGSKTTIWILPAIGFVLFLSMEILSRFPHIFNYPVEITAENAEEQYRNGIRMIRILIIVITGFFVYLMYENLRGAIEGESSLNPIAIIFFVTVVLSITGYSIYKSVRLKTK